MTHDAVLWRLNHFVARFDNYGNPWYSYDLLYHGDLERNYWRVFRSLSQ